jgi:tetratricopeptide (TPR) repeat protein
VGSVDDPDDVTVPGEEPADRPATVLGWTPPTSPTGESQRPSVPERRPIVELEVGQRIGDRYEVRALLGRGGMGAVYAALDEKLGEEVALKVVGDDLAGQLRDEVRLAQKVAHPNVCRTYDLAEVDGQYFIKMELLAGETLAQRLKRDRKQPIDEAVRVARAVGAGLVAAHDSGIIHRDLKPSNVMLVGERVVLMDFGIAKTAMSAMKTLAGTFGYMAPEQFANTRIDRRADLYALGCLLYEMLAGELVFGSANPVELAARHVMMAAPDVRAKRPDTPRWLARAVAALLAKDPAARDAGWARLEAGPRSLRRFALPAAAVAIAGAGGAMLLLSHLRTAPRPPPCRGIEQRLAGVWDEPVKKQVEAAFAATKKPYAAKAFAGVANALDAYTREWTTAVTASCEATRVRGDQPEEVMTLREGCFARDLEEVRALAQVLGSADAELVAKGDQVVGGLEPIPRCANVAELRAPDQPPDTPKIGECRVALVGADVQMIAGHQMESLNLAKHAEHLADELQYRPYQAEALEIQGVVLGLAGNADESASHCAQAAQLAMLGRSDTLAVDAAVCAANATSAKDVNVARVWAELGRTLLGRIGQDPEREARVLGAEHLVAMLGGEPDKALEAQEKQLAIIERTHGKESMLVILQEESAAEALAKNGAYAKATPHFERAVAALETSLGVDHPIAASMLTNLGACYAHIGETGKAHAAYTRALEILSRTEGEASPNVVMTLNNMADAAIKAKDPSGALVYLDRAKNIVDRSLGEANPLSHAVYTTRAEALTAAGRLADARPQYDQAIELEAKYHSPYLAQTLTSRAQLELGAKKWADAATFEQRAIAAAEALGGPESPDLWQPLAGLARAQIELGKKKEAPPLLQRAITVAEKAQVAPEDLEPVRALLAKLR